MNAAARTLLCLIVVLAACHRNEAPPPAPARAGSGAFVVQEWPLPAAAGAAEPNLQATADGRLLLSWVSSVAGRRNALQFVDTDQAGRWRSAPRTIAVGNAMLANWADTPHILATPDGALWVHWLQKAPDDDGTSIMLARSTDDGFSWSSPLLVDGGTPTEHGFASLWPAGQDTLGMAWLAGVAQDANGAHASGATTALRSAVFDRNLQRSAGTQVDPMACDCCRTAVAMTPRGALLAYRDRSADDIRDIVTTRFDGRGWSRPTPVHADGWKITGCPVNGPALATLGNDVIVAWYTGAHDSPAVQLARSGDAGDHFAAPVVVDKGPMVHGRVAVALDARQAWVAWVREDARGASLWLARYAPDLSHELQRFEVARLRARGSGAGYPQLALRADAAFLVWTDSVDGAPQLRGAQITR